MTRTSPIREIDPPQSQIVRYTLTTRQVAALHRAGQRLGISASEVLRRLLDQWISQHRYDGRG